MQIKALLTVFLYVGWCLLGLTSEVVDKQRTGAQFENSYFSIKTKLHILLNLKRAVEFLFTFFVFYFKRALGHLFSSFASLSTFGAL